LLQFISKEAHFIVGNQAFHSKFCLADIKSRIKHAVYTN